ncbi:putative triple gene block protein 1 [Potexvirus nesignambrosiae]|uniref:Triple gene block protein 1 n=3 Tax=Potexvirus nesignambrosiae TaxID=1417304 RepID=B0FXP6_9VIRU|nr:putative triple gene block protein 1 [Ambrosia asymptomatic virus 1]ABY53441.1 triple gene block protein 1 [Ambrosia asymptomatic virus 1 UKM-2007]AHB87034.1 putative triple gene block protein 1 [Ambrosia asymptomatic virus 1]
MDVIISKILESGFTRTDEPISEGNQVVVHAIAGSGKTRLIKELLDAHNFIRAYTHGPVPSRGISGRSVIKATSQPPQGLPEGTYTILDEYLAGPSEGYHCLLADPFQYAQEPKRAHFIGTHSHRFGRNTAALLTSLGFTCSSARSDVVLHTDYWKFRPTGQAIAFQAEVCANLRANNLEHTNDTEALGKTYKEVAFYHTDWEELKEEDYPDRHKLYICLTRHRSKLTLVSPDHPNYPQVVQQVTPASDAPTTSS